jgi:hypothetical protein
MVSRWENARYLRASYPVIEHIVAVCRALSSIGFPVAHYSCSTGSRSSVTFFTLASDH